MTGPLHDISWVLPLRADWLTPIMFALTWLGYFPFFLIALPLAYWLWDKAAATRLAVLIMVTAVLNGFLKDLIQDPRPDPALFALDGDRTSTSYGLPSGHAQVAMVMWTWIALEIRRAWAWALAAALIAGIGFSRLYLGVHDLEDVLGGYALGGATLVGFAWLLNGRLTWWTRLHPAAQIALILAVQPVIWLTWPPEGGSSGALAVMGFIASWWIGVIYDRRRADFRRHPNLWIALPAAVVAVVIVLMLMNPIAQGFMSLGLPKIAANWAQLFVAGFYVTLVAPWLFRVARVGR